VCRAQRTPDLLRAPPLSQPIGHEAAQFDVGRQAGLFGPLAS
jgi:hypothetical protein